MTKGKLVSLLIAGAMGLFVASVPDSAAAWEHHETRVSAVKIWDDGHAVVLFADWPTAQNNNCGSPWFSLGTANEAKQKGMLQTALAAFLSGKRVHVVTHAGSCQGNEERVASIELY